jgi:hypothetical protein
MLSIKHYHWLRDPIHRLPPPNSKANYLVRIIQRILNSPTVMNYHCDII